MKDEIYNNALKEVYDILKNTDEDLIKKIPQKFLNFVKENMNQEYISNIDYNIEIDKQKLLPETEAILSLIYKSYWEN